MSVQLLKALNGARKGSFYRYINSLKKEPVIAWYPSAGEDFRDLLYLSEEYSKFNSPEKEETEFPDLYLHTDYFPWTESTFMDDKLVHEDSNTKIEVKSIEELPKLDLPVDMRIVDFPGSIATNKVLFLWLKIESKQLGTWEAPVLYVFSENAAFCEKLAIPHNAVFKFIVHVRFGGGCGGGGRSSGIWLLNILKKLGCRVLVTDGHYHLQDGDIRIYQVFPGLSETADLEKDTIREIPGRYWSRYGNIKWESVN